MANTLRIALAVLCARNKTADRTFQFRGMSDDLHFFLLLLCSQLSAGLLCLSVGGPSVNTGI